MGERTWKEERELIWELTEANPIKKDEYWYPIEYRWWKTWSEYVNFKAKAESLPEAAGGPRPIEIDNNDLKDAENPVKLKTGLMEHYHYEIVHQSVWEKLQGWYGGGPAFPRKVITRGITETESVELYPHCVQVVPMKEADGEPDAEGTWGVLVGSKDTFQNVIEEAAKKFGKPIENFRIWRENVDEEKKSSTWNLMKPVELKKLIEVFEFEKDSKVMLEKKKDSGEWIKTVEERVWNDFRVGDLVDGLDKMNKWYESTIRDVKDGKVLIHYNGWPSKWDEWLPVDSERLAEAHTHTTGPYVKKVDVSSSYGGYYGFSMASSEEGKPIHRGIVGLRNLGNTCFMNSTLQCLTATEPLVDYWTKDEYKKEINRENALGWQGKVADEYGSLVKEMWSDKYKVVVPRGFKTVIGEFAPRFSGYQQQDSSELLGFLLDGLHEDLNRIKKKPYTEPVEDKGRPDEVVAEEAWRVHKLRHDSIIVDTFQGQLKSKLHCPKCDRVSVIFDPFMFLSVPLPTETDKLSEITVIFADPKKRATVYGVKVPKMGTVIDLKKTLGKQTGIPFQRLVVAEIWRGRVYKFFPNNHMLQDLRPSDDIYAWEVPALDSQPEQKEVERGLPYSIQQVMMFVVKEESASWLSSTKRTVVETVGMPFPIVVSKEKMLWSDVKKLVNESLAPYLTPGYDASAAYRLRELEYSASALRDEIPADDYLIDFDRRSVGIEWLDVKAFNEGRIVKPDLDTSVPPKTLEERTSSKGAAAIPLSDCIDKYTEEETLTEQNAWYCPSCKDFVCAKKKFDLWKVPSILIIHLKRFQYSAMYRDKIDTFVDFPLEGLDMSKWAVKKDKALLYDCYAVSNHMGGLGGGHYTAYVRNHEDGKWYDLNDSSATSASASEIKSSSAYVLFYKLRK